ncbi:MAG: hypothetical protein AB7V14_01550 [Kiritimatiellia bacterium]
MKNLNWLGIGTLGFAAAAFSAFGQPQAIQPSPAYYRSGGTYVLPAPAAQPATVPPARAAPVYQPQPVYYVVPSALTLAPAPAAVEEEDEEGFYWFWGSKWPGTALGAKIGTTGLGLDFTFGVSRWLNLRGGFNYGSFTWSMDLDDVDYDMDVSMVGFPLLVDLHPFANHFRISGGLFIQPGTEADIEATPGGNVQIGSHTYPPEVVGKLSGKIEADAVAPYLGIGFGNATAEDQLLTFMLDLGVIIESYDVSLTSDGAGMTAKLDTFREDVEKEEANLKKDLDDFKIYPVLTLGLAWHF